MTKEDFKKKYHGKSVKIEASMQVHHFGEIADKPRRIQEMCKLMGLETHQVTVPAPYLLITIVDKQQEFRTNAEPLTPISEEEFLADFKEVHEELEFVVAKKLLADLKVEYGSMTKLSRSSQNMKQVSEEGFIQGYTSNDASIWWHPMGRRLFFVRGEGVFELTDKSE
jgi:hypothetical protein